MQTCPRCIKGYLANRTKRSLMVKIFLFWLPIRRYKCNYCAAKVYVYGNPKTEKNTLEAI